jgi:beta-glucanase (GH16 family)
MATQYQKPKQSRKRNSAIVLLLKATTFQVLMILGAFAVIGTVFIAGSLGATSDSPNGVPGNWQQVWADEFDDTTIDAAKWDTKEPWHSAPGFANDPSHNGYCPVPAPRDLIVESGGTVKINALARPTAGFSMQACFLTSREHYNTFKHGYIEARVKQPAGADLWTAFWLLGNGTGSEGWPKTGEIDIFEFVNNRSGNGEPVFTVHWQGPCESGNHCAKQQDNPWQPSIPTYATQFHTYGLLRTPTELRFYLDGVYKFKFDRNTTNSYGQKIADIIFNGLMHIRFDIGSGGDWAEDPSKPSRPGVMEVDYVRAWTESTAPPDTTKPSAALTAPVSGGRAFIGSVVQIAAAATDSITVAKVEFYNGTTLLGTDTTTPYSYDWNTQGIPAGSKQLTAKAYDASGNWAASAPVAFTLESTPAGVPGYANGDGAVNALDLSIVISRYGQNYPMADFNKDGTVGAADLAILLAKWTW